MRGPTGRAKRCTEDLATLREISAKYRRTDVRGAIPVVSESVGQEVRNELTAKRRGEQRGGFFSVGLRVGSRKVPQVCHKLYEVDFTPPWMHALMSKQQATGWTHVRFDTQPERAGVPWGIQVARTREGIAKVNWETARKIVILERVPNLDGVFEYKAEIEAPMRGDGSAKACPMLSTLVEELPPQIVTLTLFKRRPVPEGDEAAAPQIAVVSDVSPAHSVTAAPRDGEPKVSSDDHATSERERLSSFLYRIRVVD